MKHKSTKAVKLHPKYLNPQDPN